jgi:hypothetical protein
MECQPGEMCVQRDHNVQCERISEEEEERQRQDKQRQRDTQNEMQTADDMELTSDLDLGMDRQDQNRDELADQSILTPLDLGTVDQPTPSTPQEGCAQLPVHSFSSLSRSPISLSWFYLVWFLLGGWLWSTKRKLESSL